ncbi:uncharacterized oxidoreductase CzcO-like [Arthrobacter sp. Hiyo8]|nr:uncharacterized oxidoreductase CzcO-like [Arthrobacter sp. Hiyo8]
MARDDVVDYFRDYATRIDAPVRTGTDVTWISTSDGSFSVETSDGGWRARNVVLATGAYQIPKIPALSAGLPKSVLQLHTHDYRNPEQLPDGAALIVGTGQSGGQIAEDLLAAGREVHLAVSTCPEAPRRYRGHDILYWLLQAGIHGPEYGINALTVGQLPSPAARFACNPLLSGTDGATTSTSANSAAKASSCTGTWKQPTTANSPSRTTSHNASQQSRPGSASAWAVRSTPTSLPLE